MRILMTNVTLAGRSGTETVTRDLALGYARAGHDPIVYTRSLGPLAEELRARSVPVTDRVEDLAGEVDVIHGHHLNACLGVLARYPHAPAVSAVHDFTTWYDDPPRLPNVRLHVAISDHFTQRLAYQGGVPPDRIRVVLNGVDTDRFRPGRPLPETPARALMIGKGGGAAQVMGEACARAGMTLEVIGEGGSRMSATPEQEMGEADLVFASARSAIEAMSCLRPVIVCDGRGMAGMVTPESYPDLRRNNFGLRELKRPLTVQACLDELERYDPATAEALGQEVRRTVGLDAWAAAWIAVLEEAVASPAPSETASRIAWAQHLERWSPRRDAAWPWMAERNQLLAERDRLSAGLEALAPGDEVVFTSDGWRADRARLSGFLPLEAWGVWTGLRQGEVHVQPSGPEVAAYTLQLRPFVPAAAGEQRVSASINGVPVATWSYAPEEHLEVQERRLPRPTDTAGVGGLDRITLTVEALARPCDLLPGSVDDRPLGVGLIRLTASA